MEIVLRLHVLAGGEVRDKIRSGIGCLCLPSRAWKELMLSFRVRTEDDTLSLRGRYVVFGGEDTLLATLDGVVSCRDEESTRVIFGCRGGGVTSLMTGNKV